MYENFGMIKDIKQKEIFKRKL